MELNLQTQSIRHIQVWIMLMIAMVLLTACDSGQSATPTNVPATPVPPTVAPPPATVVTPTMTATSAGVVPDPVANTCPDMTGVVETVRQTCSGLDNQACVGRQPILAQNLNGAPLPTNVGYRHSIIDLSFLEPQDEHAMAPLNANWDGFNIDLIVFGNTRIRQEVPTSTFSQQPQPRTATIRSSQSSVNHRGSPSSESNENVIGAIPNGATVIRLQQSMDNEWALVSYNDGTRITYGWVAASLLSFPVAPGGNQNPVDSWQAFSVSGETTAPTCTNAPYGGVLLQSPSGSGVSFQVNGVIVYMGSTVLIRPLDNDRIRIINLEGNVAVRDIQNLVVNVSVGHYVDVDVVNGVLITVTSVQISYVDGWGMQYFVSLVSIDVATLLSRILLPSLTYAEDIFMCDAFTPGLDRMTVNPGSNQWIVLPMYSSADDNLQRLETQYFSGQPGSEILFNGNTVQRWGLSSIMETDHFYGGQPIPDGTGNFIWENYTAADVGKPGFIPWPNYSYIEYYVIPPQLPGTYIAEEFGLYSCEIEVVSASPQTFVITVPASIQWQNTGIRLRAGQTITLSASGTVDINTGDGATEMTMTASGTSLICPSGGALPNAPCALDGVPFARLVGRVGNDLFDIGTGGTFTVPNDGIIELSANDYLDYYYDNVGSYTVEITVGP